jgi:hypothetical protein
VGADHARAIRHQALVVNRDHVSPNRDVREHVLNGDPCPCMPRVVGGVTIHNSYDGREVGEVIAALIARLGDALAEHSHEWTDEQREAVEHAESVLALHWPESL